MKASLIPDFQEMCQGSSWPRIAWVVLRHVVYKELQADAGPTCVANSRCSCFDSLGLFRATVEVVQSTSSECSWSSAAEDVPRFVIVIFGEKFDWPWRVAKAIVFGASVRAAKQWACDITIPTISRSCKFSAAL